MAVLGFVAVGNTEDGVYSNKSTVMEPIHLQMIVQHQLGMIWRLLSNIYIIKLFLYSFLFSSFSSFLVPLVQLKQS